MIRSETIQYLRNSIDLKRKLSAFQRCKVPFDRRKCENLLEFCRKLCVGMVQDILPSITLHTARKLIRNSYSKLRNVSKQTYKELFFDSSSTNFHRRPSRFDFNRHFVYNISWLFFLIRIDFDILLLRRPLNVFAIFSPCSILNMCHIKPFERHGRKSHDFNQEIKFFFLSISIDTQR